MSVVDLQAERVLALTLVHQPTAFDYVGGVIDYAMFADPLARSIVEAVTCLCNEGQQVTPVSVQARLASIGKSGTAIPTWPKGKTVEACDAKALAERLRDLWARREIEALASRLSNIAEERGTGAAIEAMVALQETLTVGRDGSQTVVELAMKYMDEANEQLLNPNKLTRFATGYPRLDTRTGGLTVGQLAVLAARPSSGKTSFVMGMIVHLARTNVPVGCFWLEDEWRDAVRRYYQTRHRVPSNAWRDPGRAASLLALHVPESFEEARRIHVDDTHGLTIEDIAARMRRMKREHGVRVFFADHLGEIRIEKDDRWGDRHDLALGRAAKVFRDTAKDLDAVPVLVAQMNRQVEKRSSGQAVMSDLDGSGKIEQAARLIAFCSVPKNDDGEPTGEFVVDVAKNTNGAPGRIQMRWVADQMRVEDLG